MNMILPLLMALVERPYHAVSKPTLMGWASLSRKARALARRFRMEGAYSFLASEVGSVKVPSKAEELREQAAAKLKEAEGIVEAAAKEAGKTVDEVKADESLIPAEELAKVDAAMEEYKSLFGQYEAAAKSEGRWEGLREAHDFMFSKATGKAVPWNQPFVQNIERPKSLGEQFVESEEYKELLDSGVLNADGGKWRTEGVSAHGSVKEFQKLQREAYSGNEQAMAELKERLAKATTDLIHSGSGGPGDALIIEQFLPGILALPARPLTVRQLFGSGQATSDVISYARQSTRESGAAAVAQATAPNEGAKPQSSISWERTTTPVETIATFMAATRQQLADAPQVQSIIDNQGRSMLQLAEEDQLVAGDGNSPNLEGIAEVTGVQTLAVDAGADADETGLNNLKAVRSARKLVRTGTSRLQASAILIHPDDSEEIDLLTDNNGLFRGGNPVGNFTFNQPLWGLQRVESEALTAGVAYVGAFNAGASVFERQGITVYTTDSHSDWFVRNIVAVLFEERLAFPVFFPTAFVEITFAEWGTPT